jgi:hypothetical protein
LIGSSPAAVPDALLLKMKSVAVEDDHALPAAARPKVAGST